MPRWCCGRADPRILSVQNLPVGGGPFVALQWFHQQSPYPDGLVRRWCASVPVQPLPGGCSPGRRGRSASVPCYGDRTFRRLRPGGSGPSGRSSVPAADAPSAWRCRTRPPAPGDGERLRFPPRGGRRCRAREILQSVQNRHPGEQGPVVAGQAHMRHHPLFPHAQGPFDQPRRRGLAVPSRNEDIGRINA